MQKIGIIKDIDKLGRLVIPKKYRELYGVEEKAEIILTDEGILIRKPTITEFSKAPTK
jgi:bifunctional DNA-binding transcriptional regulator/antitoxin component of YhaV-PrlF toxin-antitoxin module